MGLKFSLKKVSDWRSISGKVVRIVSARVTTFAIRACCRLRAFTSAWGVRLAATICQLTPAKTMSATMTMPRITRIKLLVLFDIVLADGITRVQRHDNFAATGF